jgi:D-alanyl-D-alanine carboxypeptidase
MLRSGLRRFFLLAGVLAVGATVAATPADARRKRQGGGYNPPYASIVIDVNSGRVLQATNADAPRFPASVTKVMTLYMLFEQLERGKLKLDTPLPVSSFAARQAPSKIGFDPGETIEVEDAIKALVTKSANDVAVVVAEAIGGDQDTFAQMMTRKARSLGMTNTTFRNASGLPNPEQVTTARDLTVLGRAIHDHFPKYWRYFQTRNFEFAGRNYRNHNKLLGRVDGVDGIKTGYTRASGFNLLTSARDGNRHVMAVVLGGRSGRIRDQQMASLVENHIESASGGGRTAPMIARGGEEPTRVAAAVPASTSTPPRAEAPAPVAARAEMTAQQRIEARMTARAQTEVARAEVARAEPARAEPARAETARPEPARAEPVKLVAVEPEIVRPAARAAQAPLLPPAPVPVASIPNRVPSAGAVAQPVSAFAPPPAQPGPQLRWTTGPQPAVQSAAPAQAPAAAAAPPVARVVPARQAAVAAVDPVTTASAQPAAPKAAPATQALPARTGFVIQLGATDDEGKARAILDNAKSRNRTILADASAFTEKVQKGDATLFRARFGGFDDNKDALAACGALRKTGFNCFVQRI